MRKSFENDPPWFLMFAGFVLTTGMGILAVAQFGAVIGLFACFAGLSDQWLTPVGLMVAGIVGIKLLNAVRKKGEAKIDALRITT